MSEYESAFFAALLVIVKAVPRRVALAEKLREMALDSKTGGAELAAGILDMLARSAESDATYRPGPFLRVVPSDDDKKSN
jgi:hypothetical protein